MNKHFAHAVLASIVAGCMSGERSIHSTQAPITNASLFASPGVGRCANTSTWDGWCPQLGGFAKNGTSLDTTAFTVINGTNRSHAEAQRMGVVGADFTYSADVKIVGGVGAEAHLQFRVTDEGRYGLLLRSGRVTLYQQLRLPDTEDWNPATQKSEVNAHYAYTNLNDVSVPTVVENQWLTVTITATSSQIGFAVKNGGTTLHTYQGNHSRLKVGRFGVYSNKPTGVPGNVMFNILSATTNVTAPSNFALLYSPLGYELGGTKRLLVRSLNPVPATAINLAGSTYKVRQGGNFIAVGSLQPVTKTFGMNLWSADFTSDIVSPGYYTIRIELQFNDGTPPQLLETNNFPVEQRLLTNGVLRQLTVLNAEARLSGARDEDVDGWYKESGAGTWTAMMDGTLTAYGADRGAGSTIRRERDMFYFPIPADESSPLWHKNNIVVGQMAILSGCDAQMQFRSNGVNRYGVTLQAGMYGSCSSYSGLPMIRLHEEGSNVPGGFRVIASQLMPWGLFLLNHPYNVLVWFNAQTNTVEVQLDGQPILSAPIAGYMNHGGKAGFKAWGATARFTKLQMWRPTATVVFQDPIAAPTNPGWPNSESSGEYIAKACNKPAPLTCSFNELVPVNGTVPIPEDHKLEHAPGRGGEPVFAQRHGFHDCNNFIAEAVSHGAFVAGLVEVWNRRVNSWSSDDRERLREAIRVGVSYQKQLYDQAGRTGEYAHGEYGRSGLLTNLGWHQTQYALYGDAAFAETGDSIDKPEARLACMRAFHSANFLYTSGRLPLEQQALFFYQLSVCAGREDITFNVDSLPAAQRTLPMPKNSQELETYAASAATALVGAFPAQFPDWVRDTGRVIPWFEGVYKVKTRLGTNVGDLNAVANVFTNKLLGVNGFRVVPQASGPFPDLEQQMMVPPQPSRNRLLWDYPDPVPNPLRAFNLERDYYHVYGMITSATDMVLLGRLLPARTELKKLAAAHLQWVMGINPGVPATKMTTAIPGGTSWSAAPFIWGHPTTFARGFEGLTSGTPGLANGTLRRTGAFAWENADHREAWWVRPVYNGFMSLMNGNMLWQGEWDHLSIGKDGWTSGETFILGDGLFVKAFTNYEDWLAGI